MTAPGQKAASTNEARADEAFAGILQSPAFAKAPSLRLLLTFLWEHRNEPISEYALATEALGRASGFDPRVDATVRVVVARLRQRLKEFYEGEGLECPLRLGIPLGGHQLSVELKEVGQEPAIEAVPLPTSRRFPWIPCALGLSAAVAGLAIGLLLPRPGQARPSLPPFWAAFLQGGKPTSVYVPTPVFVSWADSPVRMRDVRINDPSRVLESGEIASLAKRLGPPQFSQSYTVGPDTFAAVKLAQYLETRGVHVQVAGTNSLAIDTSLDRNIVLPGTSWSSSGVKALTAGANFQIALENTDVIQNRAPRPGEKSEYRTRRITQQRSVHYGIILQRTTSTATRQLALAGIHTDVLVSFLTAPDSLAELERAWQQAGRPQHFEALVEAETEGETALRARLLAFRPLPSTR
ncbi:helix-turn-helix domain-containing protein [uncultured Paludibaculum sp.]|uniref:helix-turn-helix domain-containing protein n=1 Tax=uncultured Paludibaculum sp. TaxID=1765020 RepID=UPI002AAC139E|nr:helix-turn-helix domain-containing protein [uncultured Paludibaculum sp.]